MYLSSYATSFCRGTLGSRIRKVVSNSSVGDDRTGEWVLESLVSPYREESLAVTRKVGWSFFKAV